MSGRVPPLLTASVLLGTAVAVAVVSARTGRLRALGAATGGGAPAAADGRGPAGTADIRDTAEPVHTNRTKEAAPTGDNDSRTPEATRDTAPPPGTPAPQARATGVATADDASRPRWPLAASPPQAGGTPPPRAHGGTPRAWAELLRLPALFTVPGDALAGAAASGARADCRILLAVGSSLCLYEAGMALNDWADRAEDAVERPHRPLPSGRVAPAAALAVACALTALGLGLAARAGRPALTVAGALAGTVWAYDLRLKHTPAGPVAMGAARGLDLLLGAAVGAGRIRDAGPSAAVLGAHTVAVTAVSRREAEGGSATAPLAALAVTAAVAHTVMTTNRHDDTGGQRLPADRRTAAVLGLPGTTTRGGAARDTTGGILRAALAAAYLTTTARPLLHAVLNPSPPLTQQAVGAGIRAMIPLQAALAARADNTVTALLTAALGPAARTFARKVSVT